MSACVPPAISAVRQHFNFRLVPGQGVEPKEKVQRRAQFLVDLTKFSHIWNLGTAHACQQGFLTIVDKDGDHGVEQVRKVVRPEKNSEHYFCTWSYDDESTRKSQGVRRQVIEWPISKDKYESLVNKRTNFANGTLPISKARYHFPKPHFLKHKGAIEQVMLDMFYGAGEVPGSANLGAFAKIQVEFKANGNGSNPLEDLRANMFEDSEFLPFIFGDVTANEDLRDHRLAQSGVPETIYFDPVRSDPTGRQISFVPEKFGSLRENIGFAEYKTQFTQDYYQSLLPNNYDSQLTLPN